MAAPRDGICIVDKPAGWTSHDVVAKARGILGTRRVGHSGTLDPDATGVLLLGVGRATRLMRFITPLRKSYTGELVLGTETSTLDASGEVTATYDMRGVRIHDVRKAAQSFLGEIDQVPPMVSAVKVGGRRLHELARRGEEVDRMARRVVVHRLDVAAAAERGVFTISVECSAGTYVRSLAADIGAALGGGAHLRNLRRTAIGSFTIDEARSLDALELLPPAEAVRDYPAVSVGDDVASAIAHGAVLAREQGGFIGSGPWAVLREGTEELLAMYEARDDRVKPVVVLAGRHPTGSGASGGDPA